MELRPSSNLTFKPDFPPHHSHHARTDSQAKPGATVLACGRGVGLSEGREDGHMLLGGDADAGVGYSKFYDPGVLLFGIDFHLQGDLTVSSKFDRVTHQIKKDLAQPSRISRNQLRYIGCDVTKKLQPLFIGK